MLGPYLYASTESGGRGVPELQVTGMIEWGQKSKRKTLSGRKTTPPPPTKKSHAEFPSLKFPEGIK